MVEQARRDQALYREVQFVHGHQAAPRLYLMREIYVGESDARAREEARPYLLQYWELWNRYTQFTQGGRLPESYDFWRRQAPMLHAMDFEQIVASDMVILGSPDRGGYYIAPCQGARPDGARDDLQTGCDAL
jgi:hypothetical protein